VKILVAHPGPSYSVQDVYAGWVEGLQELGVKVVEFNLGDRLQFYASCLLPTEEEGQFTHPFDAEQATEMATNGLYAAILKVRPHVLLLVSAFFIPLDLMDIARAAGVKVAVIHTESPYQDGQQLKVAAHADLNLLNDPLNLDQFQAVAPSEYMPHAYRPSLHKPGPVDPALACDFGFVGTGYPSRVAFFERMNLDGLKVRLAGNWAAAEESPLRRYVGHDLDECFDNDKTVRLYNSATASMNVYRREREDGSQSDEGWAMGPREVELAAAGTFFLRDPRPEGDEVLPMLPTFTGPEDAGEQLRWWLTHPDKRQDAALKAREAIADRTFITNAGRLLRLLEKE
jgi:spore maturation protein CgeB